ncbi:MAG TPA: Trk system potassium transporter TrkA [Firmicutes bacterium]|nr:Trk system potassium transporter TrkA [Bacillota bacterium]
MKIIIVGVGKLGEYLAKSLVKDNNEVTLIDTDFSSCQDVINNEDLNYINGNGLDSATLEEAGIRESDLLISVMASDEQNVMCCLLGKTLGVTHTIARIRNPEYANSIDILKEKLGLSMAINPEALTANHIANVLNTPSALDATTFFKGRIRMISLKVKENTKLEGLTINELLRKLNSHIIICAIERNGETIIPKGNVKLQLNDKLHITGKRGDVHNFLKFSNLITSKTKRVIISGGSNTAIYLSKLLLDIGMEVKIIEISEERCKLLSEVLPKVLVINGDVSDQNILFEEGIEKCDAFVALTSIDEENIVYSMFASLQNVPKIITKVNHINLDKITEKANIDTVITPHKIATNQIVRYVRAMQNSEASSCESIFKFDDDNFEILEFNVKNDFAKLNTKLKNIKLKDGILVIAIYRGRNIIYPNGNDIIEEKDTILVVNSKSNIKDINDILE